MWPILGPGPGLSEGHFGHSFHGVYTVHYLLCRYRDISTQYISSIQEYISYLLSRYYLYMDISTQLMISSV